MRACLLKSALLTVVTLALSGVWSPLAKAQTARGWEAIRRLMVESDVATAGIKHEPILAVMRTVPRHEFVPIDVRPYAYADMSLPIGEHQTISSPFIVAWMTQQIDPQPTDRVLEIGTGSGYQAAVLSGLVKEVYTIEVLPVLGKSASKTFKRLGYQNIEAKIGDGYLGWAEKAPFDKIIVTCSPEKVPRPLVEQLREGGRMVIPLGERYQQTLFSMIKQNGKLVVESREPTFFVPMTGKAEKLRAVQAGEPVTPLANADFEQLLSPEVPTVWYYLRQGTIEAGGPQGSAHCLTFRNRVPGRGAQALQAIGVDGSQVTELTAEVWIKAADVKPGPNDNDKAKLLVTFFDEDRLPVGQQALGPWNGTFNWQRRTGTLQVPPTARVAIVGLGLHGAIGEMSCDQVTVRAANGRGANLRAAAR